MASWLHKRKPRMYVVLYSVLMSSILNETYPFKGLFSCSKEETDLFLLQQEGQGEIQLIILFLAPLSQGMMGPVAEVVKDCLAPGISNYVQRLILLKPKITKCTSLDWKLIQVRKNWILPTDFKWVTRDFHVMVHINLSEWTLDYTFIIVIFTLIA